MFVYFCPPKQTIQGSTSAQHHVAPINNKSDVIQTENVKIQPVIYQYLDDYLDELRNRLDDDVFAKRDAWINSIVERPIEFQNAIIDSIESQVGGKFVTLKGVRAINRNITYNLATVPYVTAKFQSENAEKLNAFKRGDVVRVIVIPHRGAPIELLLTYSGLSIERL